MIYQFVNHEDLPIFLCSLRVNMRMKLLETVGATSVSK
jgi:hypothetical protein